MREENDPEVRSRILKMVNKLRIGENDPIFAVIFATGRLEMMLERAPRELNQTFENAHQQILGKLDGYEKAARRGVEHQVAQMASEAGKSGCGTPVKFPSWLAVAGGVSLLAIGFILGAGAMKFQQSRVAYAPGEPRQLTLDEAKALEWATSSEGQYAHDLVRWNEDLLGGECQQQVEGLVDEQGLTIQMGTKLARSGFCLVWTVPPDEREFME
ncbi:MAG: hypothetical protein HC795_06520 [Coleofasciculaceae cyanobacterium RL_1_1]|nr:hypothetical protein [Coleofasciculaceae cyanobacterium RL_1_1]